MHIKAQKVSNFKSINAVLDDPQSVKMTFQHLQEECLSFQSF